MLVFLFRCLNQFGCIKPRICLAESDSVLHIFWKEPVSSDSFHAWVWICFLGVCPSWEAQGRPPCGGGWDWRRGWRCHCSLGAAELGPERQRPGQQRQTEKTRTAEEKTRALTQVEGTWHGRVQGVSIGWSKFSSVSLSLSVSLSVYVSVCLPPPPPPPPPSPPSPPPPLSLSLFHCLALSLAISLSLSLSLSLHLLTFSL